MSSFEGVKKVGSTEQRPDTSIGLLDLVRTVRQELNREIFETAQTST